MEKSGRLFVTMAILAVTVCTVTGDFLVANDKKKPPVPDAVLLAQTVFVMIDPNAAVPVNDSGGNKTAREDVEKALMEWG